MNKKYFYSMLLCASFAMPPMVMAQNAPRAPRGNTQNDKSDNAQSKNLFKIANVNDDTIATLRNLQPGSKMLVNLGASAATLKADSTAYRTLQRWIQQGGVMTVYSDAATLFGFSLQTARQGNPDLGGQLFGRAVGAIPFGSEPLLWGIPTKNTAGDPSNDLPLIDENSARRGRSAKLSVDDPTTFGNLTVFYDMNEGDSLLASHPTAVPLLRVTDLARPQTDLFASAIASYGNGWIIFLPRHVEAGRAQSEQFLYNISAMAADPPLPISVDALTATAETIFGDTDVKPNYTALQKELQDRLSGKFSADNTATNADNADDAEDDVDNANDDTTPAAASAETTRLMPATLPVARSVASAMLNAINAASASSPPANADKRVAGVVALWMLQANIQHINLPTLAETDQVDGDDVQDPMQRNAQITQWLQDATELAPSAREVLFWQGTFHAQTAANPILPSPLRSSAYADAANAWKQAATATPLLDVKIPAANAVNTTDANDENNTDIDNANGTDAVPQRPPLGIGFGVPTPAIINEWAKQAQKAASVTAHEPPSTRFVHGVIIRHAQDDPTLRLAIPTINKLQGMANQFGWIVPQEEILIFPNESALASYARSLGPLDASEMPLASSFGKYGRVLGNRILMVSQPSQPIILPGTPPRIIQTGTAAAAIIARLHGDALLNALAEGGNSVPAWMRIGMMDIASTAATTEGESQQQNIQQLLEAGAANALLAPGDFDHLPSDEGQAGLAQSQAQSLMTYFYQQFGSGAVMETVQRLGAGQNINEALSATTEMSENEFFSAWFQALQQVSGGAISGRQQGNNMRPNNNNQQDLQDERQQQRRLQQLRNRARRQ